MPGPRTRRFALTALITSALVVAQWAGLAHRVEHPALAQGGGAGTSVTTAAADRDEDAAGHQHDHDDGHRHAHADEAGGNSGHHCAAYDAATLGDAPPLALATTVTATPARSTPATAIDGLPLGIAQLGYHSRAPPRA